ncbi:MAG: YtxH domain-containing protein [Polyangiaceae bacterium]
MNYSTLLRYLGDVLPYEVRRKSSNDWLLPTLVGAGLGIAAGVGLGMLVAPAPGTETRRQLSEGASRIKDRARVAASKAKERVAELQHNLENGVGNSAYLDDAQS